MLLSKIHSISSINKQVTQGYEKKPFTSANSTMTPNPLPSPVGGSCLNVLQPLEQVRHLLFLFFKGTLKLQHLLRERFPTEADLCWLTSCRLLSVALTAVYFRLTSTCCIQRRSKKFQASFHLQISRKQEIKILSVSKWHPESKISHLYAQCAPPLKCLSFYSL